MINDELIRAAQISDAREALFNSARRQLKFMVFSTLCTVATLKGNLDEAQYYYDKMTFEQQERMK